MKIKTSELTGAALDWAVCRAQNPSAVMSATHVWLDTSDGEDNFLIEATSTNPAQAYPIIYREHISVVWNDDTLYGVPQPRWVAECKNLSYAIGGPTPLIVAMRCYVASKLGEEVEVPDELV